MEHRERTQKRGRSGISAIVLAAGTSQRMGRLKQLLRLGESTLLAHTLANVRRANVNEIVLVLGFAAEEIQKGIPLNGIVTVMNPNYQQGMGTSIRTGLSAISPQAKGALIILGDQPFVNPATLNSLIEYHRHRRAQIIIPMFKGFRGNPVLLDRSVFPEIMHLQGDVGCRAIFGSHTENIHKLAVDDPGILLDVDTLADFRRLAAIMDFDEGANGLLRNAELEERAAPFTGDDAPDLTIVGRDDVAAALLRFARILGFRTTLIDPFLTLAEMPEADRILRRLDFCRLPENKDRYIVIASRGQFDEEALEEAFGSDARYVALIAGKTRREELIGVLKKRGFGEGMLNRLRAPAGLEIGAETPEEIALSIMAEIVAERRKLPGRSASHLAKK